jgi:alpha-beta hydrolase superfamily lysophospholipase
MGGLGVQYIGGIYYFRTPGENITTMYKYMACSEFVTAIRFKLLSVINGDRPHNSISYDPIDVAKHTITSAPPQCIALSSNKSCNISFPDPTRIPTIEEVEDVTRQYNEILNSSPPLESDFVNDTFVHKTTGVKFCVTRLERTGNTKNVVYLPGFNDYFFHKEYAEMWVDRGYNFYAVHIPKWGFAGETTDPQFTNFRDITALYKYLDFASSYYGYDGVDVLSGHSTGGLIGISYGWYKNHMIPESSPIFVRKMVFSSPFIDWYGRPEWWKADVFFSSEFFGKNISVSPVWRYLPEINLTPSATSVPSPTTCIEFQKRNFNPKHKTLYGTPTYSSWTHECTAELARLHSGLRNPQCPIDIVCADSSTLTDYTYTSDTVLNVMDYFKFRDVLSNKEVRIFTRPTTGHLTFLGITDWEFLFE